MTNVIQLRGFRGSKAPARPVVMIQPAYKLVNKAGDEVPLGTILIDRRGGVWKLTGFRAGSHAGSSGRVYVEGISVEYRAEYFPHVFDLEVIEA
jgi:hypothetical protein